MAQTYREGFYQGILSKQSIESIKQAKYFRIDTYKYKESNDKVYLINLIMPSNVELPVTDKYNIVRGYSSSNYALKVVRRYNLKMRQLF